MANKLKIISLEEKMKLRWYDKPAMIWMCHIIDKNIKKARSLNKNHTTAKFIFNRRWRIAKAIEKKYADMGYLIERHSYPYDYTFVYYFLWDMKGE